MKDLLNNRFQSVSETELVMVNGGECPCPWCGGGDKDESTSPPQKLELPKFEDDSPKSRWQIEPSDKGIGIKIWL